MCIHEWHRNYDANDLAPADAWGYYCSKCGLQQPEIKPGETEFIKLNREPREPADVFRNPPGMLEMKARLEALDMVASYARDIVALWPQFSLRQIQVMNNKINALKEALEMAAK